ncbi:MAG: hypothetical protein AAB628_01845 [Patescibacteria group bacterium]
MKSILVVESKQRRSGDFFKEVTGLTITDSMSVLNVERAVEQKLGRKLQLKYLGSNLVPNRDVLPSTNIDMCKVNVEIDKHLGKI